MNNSVRTLPLNGSTATLYAPSLVVPQGDGSYLLRPGKPLPPKLTVKQAARIAGTSVDTIYRLYHDGTLRGQRFSKGSIRIHSDSLGKHIAATENPEYWDNHSS